MVWTTKTETENHYGRTTWQRRTKKQDPLPNNKDLNAILLKLIEEGTQINKVTIATELATEGNWKKKEKTDEELVPQEYHEYLDVFSEEKAAQFPESRSWDHRIEIKEGFEPKSFKNYNLTPSEQLKLDKFLKGKATFDHLSHPWPLPFSSYPRKMKNSDPARTTTTWTIGQLKTPILYL